jgi:transcriptional regulator with XRE-family HTH domain
MSYLNSKWKEYHGQPLRPRAYASQREFEADWVSGLRRRYRISQEALASLAAVSVTTVQNWENPLSRKAIAAHNQDRLRDIERDLWIKSHVTLLNPCPPTIRALYDLMCSGHDASAQALAEHFVGSVQHGDPERARLLHWASLTYSITDPASHKARLYQQEALRALGEHGSDARLSAAIENEILGYQFEMLMQAQPGSTQSGSDRSQQARDLMQACERLYTRDQQPAYLWNALEVACRAPLPDSELFRLTGLLIGALGIDIVQRRIEAETPFAAARSVLQTSQAH